MKTVVIYILSQLLTHNAFTFGIAIQYLEYMPFRFSSFLNGFSYLDLQICSTVPFGFVVSLETCTIYRITLYLHQGRLRIKFMHPRVWPSSSWSDKEPRGIIFKFHQRQKYNVISSHQS